MNLPQFKGINGNISHYPKKISVENQDLSDLTFDNSSIDSSKNKQKKNIKITID